MKSYSLAVASYGVSAWRYLSVERSFALRRWAIVLLSVALNGCQQHCDGGETPSPSGAGFGPIKVERQLAKSALLLSVRAAEHPGFDRIVFRFRGGVPSYHVRYASAFRQCGSGLPAHVRGNAWLEVSLFPAAGHDARGHATVSHSHQFESLAVLRELYMICDFEGHVDWVLGLSEHERYRAFTLERPDRLVIDVLARAPRHPPQESETTP